MARLIRDVGLHYRRPVLVLGFSYGASIGLLALASLLGAVLHPFIAGVTDIVLIVTCAAIVALLVAVSILFAESRFAAELVERRIDLTTERSED